MLGRTSYEVHSRNRSRDDLVDRKCSHDVANTASVQEYLDRPFNEIGQVRQTKMDLVK